jgi:orotate phosphoribosyltransferase
MTSTLGIENSILSPEQEYDLSIFLRSSGVFKIGDFITKSGRKSPYYLNFGEVCSGASLDILSTFYAHALYKKWGDKVTVAFGPSYKGITFAVSVAFKYNELFNKDLYFSFNRKEKKQHGDGGWIVGKQLSETDKVVILEDVVTAGTTLRELIPLIEACKGAKLLGILIAVDREEKIEISDSRTAKDTLSHELELEILPMISISRMIQALSSAKDEKVKLLKEDADKIKAYLDVYSA